MTSAFVAGATGYTGSALVPLLVEAGVDTIAHIRPDSSSLEERRADFEAMGACVDTTEWQKAALSETFARLKPDIIFALLGTTKKRMRSGEDASYEKIDFGLTAMLIEAATFAGLHPRFVYLSAMGVKPGTSNPYYRARVKAEAALQGSGLPYTIARPGLITGPDREESRPLERMAGVVSGAAVEFGALLGARKLRDKFKPMDSHELAQGLVHAALDPQAENKILEADELRAAAAVRDQADQRA